MTEGLAEKQGNIIRHLKLQLKLKHCYIDLLKRRISQLYPSGRSTVSLEESGALEAEIASTVESLYKNAVELCNHALSQEAYDNCIRIAIENYDLKGNYSFNRLQSSEIRP